MKRVVFVTAHYLESRRQTGFHWMADAFWRAGWDVLFFTESISWLSWLRRDLRFDYPIFQEANRVRQVRSRLASYVWFTPFHPGNLRLPLLNRLSQPLFNRYGQLPIKHAGKCLADADLFVFDSTHGLFLFDRFKKINPRARFVYRVSDYLPMAGNHPALLAQEQRVLPAFDLVSVPAEYILRHFAHLPTVALHKHGLRTELFTRQHVNPYRGQGPFVIYVGRSHFDHDFLRQALALFPAWQFHVFGDIPGLPSAANLTTYGERPFDETIPYLQHADIGLQTRCYVPGAECLTDSLKMHQYTFCGLPIVAPDFLRNDRPHVFYYRPGDGPTIRQALLDAVSFDHARVPRHEVETWDNMVTRFAA